MGSLTHKDIGLVSICNCMDLYPFQRELPIQIKVDYQKLFVTVDTGWGCTTTPFSLASWCGHLSFVHEAVAALRRNGLSMGVVPRGCWPPVSYPGVIPVAGIVLSLKDWDPMVAHFANWLHVYGGKRGVMDLSSTVHGIYFSLNASSVKGR